jgi:hypothetical protein
VEPVAAEFVNGPKESAGAVSVLSTVTVCVA